MKPSKKKYFNHIKKSKSWKTNEAFPFIMFYNNFVSFPVCSFCCFQRIPMSWKSGQIATLRKII
jgi:hypothetical protein